MMVPFRDRWLVLSRQPWRRVVILVERQLVHGVQQRARQGRGLPNGCRAKFFSKACHGRCRCARF